MKNQKSNLKLYFILGLFFFLSSAVQAKEAYHRTLQKLTRKDQVYRSQDLKASIIWNATPLTDPLIAAQTHFYAKVYDALPEEKANLHETLLSKRGKEALFFVSFYSAERKFGDLANPKARWEVRLKMEEGVLEPSRIEKIGYPNPVEQIFYPYLTPWSRGYYVWFPIPSSGLKTPFSLSVHGAFASSTLTWKK